MNITGYPAGYTSQIAEKLPDSNRISGTALFITIELLTNIFDSNYKQISAVYSYFDLNNSDVSKKDINIYNSPIPEHGLIYQFNR